MKKGNAGIVVLIIALFITIIALCGVVLYYNLDSNNSNAEQNNNDNTDINNEQANNNNENVNTNTQQNINTTNNTSNENTTNHEHQKDDQTTNNNGNTTSNNTITPNTNTTSTTIVTLSSEDKEILRKYVPELLEDAGITGTITSQSFYQLKIKFKELAEKEDMSDAEKNQKINTFNEAVKIFEAIMLYENVGLSPVDVIWKNEISDDGRALVRDCIEFYKLKQSAQTTVFKSDMSNFMMQYSLYLANKIMEDAEFEKSTLNISYGDVEFVEIFGENVDEDYRYNLKIVNGELVFETDDDWQIEILEEMKIKN